MKRKKKKKKKEDIIASSCAKEMADFYLFIFFLSGWQKNSLNVRRNTVSIHAGANGKEKHVF